VLAYKKRYWNSCAWVDHQIKGFIEFLITNNKFEDSIIVITGDHGEEFNEHGNFFHNTNLFPEQTAVPILIKWPKGTKTPAHQHATTWAGNNGQTMVMRNNNATATFSWPNFWQNELPTDITLNSIVESGINLKLDTAEQSLTKLKELFPDAFERFIEKMEPATP